MQKAGLQLLGTIMKVEVVTPEEYMGDVIGDLNSRRGQISSMRTVVTQKLLLQWFLSRACLVISITCVLCLRSCAVLDGV